MCHDLADALCTALPDSELCANWKVLKRKLRAKQLYLRDESLARSRLTGESQSSGPLFVVDAQHRAPLARKKRAFAATRLGRQQFNLGYKVRSHAT